VNRAAIAAAAGVECIVLWRQAECASTTTSTTTLLDRDRAVTDRTSAAERISAGTTIGY
jgi:hypothetical protein